MSRMSKIVRLDKWLKSLTVTATDGSGSSVRALMTTAQADATSKLASRSGQQILAARTETVQDGNVDGFADRLGTALFVLEKGLGTARTPELEDAQFERLAALADRLLGKLAEDMTGGACDLLSGLALVSVTVTPEASVFGGWTGYSIEMTFA